MLRKIENRIFPTLNEAFENMTDGNSAIVTSSFEDLGLILCNTYYLLGFKHKLGPTEFCQVKRIGEKMKEIFFSIGIQKSILKMNSTKSQYIYGPFSL